MHGPWLLFQCFGNWKVWGRTNHGRLVLWITSTLSPSLPFTLRENKGQESEQTCSKIVWWEETFCFDKQGVNLRWFQNLLILGIIRFRFQGLFCPCSQKADRRKSQDKQGSKVVVLNAAPWNAAFGGSRKQARKALKLERLLWRGSRWNSSLRASCVLLGLTEDNGYCPMELVANRINCKMPGNRDSPDMELEEPHIWKNSFYLLPLHHPCYSLTTSAVQESNLFNHTPFSISLLPHPNLLPTNLLPLCHPLSDFHDQPYYFCLQRLSYIQIDFNHILACFKMQKGKEKHLDPLS